MNEEAGSTLPEKTVPLLLDEVVADTHAILWQLYLPGRLSTAAIEALEGARLVHISSITLIELAYLIDKGRYDVSILDEMIEVLEDPTNGFVLQPISPNIARAVRLISRLAIPDMPDRIIAATALHLGLPLVTVDSKIHSSGLPVIW